MKIINEPMRRLPQALKAERPKGDTMNTMMRALGPAVGLFIAVSPGLALAQTDGAASDLTEAAFDRMTGPESWPEVTWPAGAAGGVLPPGEILAEVRREGFYP